jgi:hypothetical protein
VRIFTARSVTSPKESISIDEALEKAVRPDMIKLILKARTQMIQSVYKYFENMKLK